MDILLLGTLKYRYYNVKFRYFLKRFEFSSFTVKTSILICMLFLSLKHIICIQY